MCAQNSTLRSVTHCRVQLRAVSHCTELAFKIYRRSKMVSHCMESNSAQCDSARSFAESNFVFAALSLPWLRILNFFFKYTFNIATLPNIKKKHFKGQAYKKKFEYLRKNEFLRKTVLPCLSGAQVGAIHEKNRDRKSRDSFSLRWVTKILKKRGNFGNPAGYFFITVLVLKRGNFGNPAVYFWSQFWFWREATLVIQLAIFYHSSGSEERQLW